MIHSVKYKHLLSFIIAAIFIFIFAFSLSSAIEQKVYKKINNEITLNKIKWMKLNVDGLKVYLSGEAPSGLSKVETNKLIQTLVSPSRIIDRTTVSSSATEEEPNFQINLVRTNTEVSVTGIVPNKIYKETILKKLQKFPNLRKNISIFESLTPLTIDLSDRSLDFVIWSLSLFSQVSISINNDNIQISAAALNSSDAELLTKKMRAEAPKGLPVKINIIFPKPLISPFSFEYLATKEYGVVRNCSSTNLDSQNLILKTLQNLSLKEPALCPIGIGSPSPNWEKAIIASIQSLHSIGQGSVKISDLQVNFFTKIDKEKSTINKIIETYKKALPKEFTLNIKLETEPGNDDSVILNPSGILIEKDTLGNIAIKGQLGTGLEEQIIYTYAKAIFSNSIIDLDLTLNRKLPKTLTENATVGMEALRELHKGVLVVDTNKLKVSGVSDSILDAGKIRDFLKNNLDEAFIFEIDIFYDKSLNPTPVKMTPQGCINSIKDLLINEKIIFEPASAEIKGSSRVAIKKIATILKKCEDIKIEIGGHTDSQGTEKMNLDLSQLRAEAVKTALLTRRILVRNLTPKGYGEVHPIADNETEQGREINRRIEFKAIDNNNISIDIKESDATIGQD